MDRDRATLDKSVPQHDEMRRLITRLRGLPPTDRTYEETFMELTRDVLQHLAEEETKLRLIRLEFFSNQRVGQR